MTRSLAFLPYLRAFEAVARLGTLKRATEELNLSPGAISLQLRKLSERTGASLFEKAGTNVVLTAAGRDFSEATFSCSAGCRKAYRGGFGPIAQSVLADRTGNSVAD